MCWGAGGPDQGSGVVVVSGEVVLDRGDQVWHGVEHAAAQGFVGEHSEPAFDQVQPGARGRGEVEVDPGMAGQPGGHLGVFVVCGGWCGHGETYWSDDDVLWWSKGGVLKGTSPARIAFLRRVLEEAPGDLEPHSTEWDAPMAMVGDGYRLTCFSFMRPSYRTFVLPAGTRWRADVIDTWEMTVTPVDHVLEGVATIDLPGRPYIAVRVSRI